MTAREPVPERLARGPFTTRDGLRHGIGRHVLEGRAIARVTRGVHVVGHVDETALLKGLLLVLPAGSVFSCHTSARLWSLPAGWTNSTHVHVQAPGQVRRAGVVAHVGVPDDVVRRHGLPVTSPVATFVDLAVHLDDAELLACGDAIVRRGFTTVDGLVAATATATRRRGSARARRVASLVRPGVDSPMESLLRHVLTTAGLPEPEVNLDVVDSHGGWIARPDLSYPDRRIAIEYDGRHHFDDRRQWENDIARRHNLEDEGWVVRIATDRDVFVQADRFGAEMRALWRRRA
ncbi:MAG TPA: hypothetical protein VIM10_14300 [Actinopolymorphaceae bacterium]|jgi:hypothetical protein